MVNVRCKENHTLSNRGQNHGHNKSWPTSVSIRVGWKNEVPDEHSDEVARSDKPNIFLWFAEKIKLLDPIINVLWVRLIESEQVLVEIQVVFAYELLGALFPLALRLDGF